MKQNKEEVLKEYIQKITGVADFEFLLLLRYILEEK